MIAARRSVQGKLILVTATTLILVGLTSFISVWWFSDRAILERQSELEHQIRENITNKGRVLTKSHAVALRPLASDNAFSDARELIESTVSGDSDIIYGLFLTKTGQAWAYTSPNHPPSGDPSKFDPNAWKELKLDQAREAGKERQLFGQTVIEFSQPVVMEGETLGTVHYGMTVASVQEALSGSRTQANQSKQDLLNVLSMISIGILVLGSVAMVRASRTITRPLNELTDTAKRIGAGDRGLRAQINSGDEVEILAGAFNDMLEENEKQFLDLEKTTEQALAASRLKSEFLANMSHEIRTPMNGVLGMIKLVLRQPLDAKARRYADTVQASAHSLMTIVNDILDFSKMEAGKYTLQTMSFDARSVVQEVAELLSTRAQESGVELIYRIQPGFPDRINGDPDRFRQVLNNLVGNAVKFTDHGEIFIDIGFEQLEDGKIKCTLSVIDSGIGIAPEAIEGLFDAFSQADGSMRRAHGGTGLGLTISRRLARMMGGDIQVESTLGVGSKFTVTFLFDEAVTPRSTKTPDWTIGKRIAVMEPSPRWAHVIGEHLQTWGVEAVFFKNRETALHALQSAALEERPFDALIVGLRMSEETAEDFITQVRAHPRLTRLPVVVLTQLGSSATLSEVANEITAQVQKPLRLSELFNALQGTFLGTANNNHTRPLDDDTLTLSGRTILVVDDNEINQIVACEELQLAGFSTDVANNGAEALEKIKNKDYPLVLMDCQMPVMDGYSATRAVREHEAPLGKHTLIVALTAHALGGERERVLAAGMDDYMSKPFRPETLRKLLRHHGVTTAATSPAAKRLSVVPASVETTEEPELNQEVRRSPRVIALFLKNVPEQLDLLEKAVSSEDAQELRAQAHKLKGSCLSLGAPRMAHDAEALQKLAEKGELDHAGQYILSLKNHFSRVQSVLDGDPMSA